MDQVLLALDSAWRVFIVCLLLGAGLPALYTVGIRQLATADGAGGAKVSAPALHRVIAYVLFAVVIIAILLGLTFITATGFGYTMSFNGIVPVFKHK